MTQKQGLIKTCVNIWPFDHAVQRRHHHHPKVVVVSTKIKFRIFWRWSANNVAS